MNKLLIVCGPTATGKTDLAITLAKKLDGELISADSRQVFCGMDIGTGKDLSSKETIDRLRLKVEFRQKQYSLAPYKFHGVPLWLVDVVNPDEDFSVSHFYTLATRVITDIFKAKKLPIVVGGTGLYIRSLAQPLDQIKIPQNHGLRKQFAEFTVFALQRELQKVDQRKYDLMNSSDRLNPRRLIRAIEIIHWQRFYAKEEMRRIEAESQKALPILDKDVLWIGLMAPLEELFNRIDKRVDIRVKQGIIQEVKTLLSKGYDWNLPSMSGMGYRQWKEYFEASSVQRLASREKKELVKKIIEQWKKDECDYAKRQMTWFRANNKISWFDITQPQWMKHVKLAVDRWYNH